VDALDTLILVGLWEEFDEGRKWVQEHFTPDMNHSVSVFEATIRVLGGLLSAHWLQLVLPFGAGLEMQTDRSQSPARTKRVEGSRQKSLRDGDSVGDGGPLLRNALALGDKLLRAWRDSPLPHERLNLHTGDVEAEAEHLGSTISEVGTLQLEFRSLDRLASADGRFEFRADHVMDFIGGLLEQNAFRWDGLLPIMLRPEVGLMTWTQSRVTLGGRGDSFFEYLLKQWLLTNRTEEKYLRWYHLAMRGVRRHMLGHVGNENASKLGRAIIRDVNVEDLEAQSALDPDAEPHLHSLKREIPPLLLGIPLPVTAFSPLNAAEATTTEAASPPVGDPQKLIEMCSDDANWRDAEGDGCEVYAETIRSGEDASVCNISGGGAWNFCPQTCGACMPAMAGCACIACVCMLSIMRR